MRDLPYDADDETPYECFECGTIITARASPGSCPDCGGALRHRLTPFE